MPDKDAAPSAGPEIRVLLVDDEERFRRSLADRLKLRGFAVDQTGDPEEAVKIVRLRRPDVVVLDRKMPKMDGEAVLREVKKIAPSVQVVMLTGHGSVESATESGRLDAFAYLTKPCETNQLVETIEAAHREKYRVLARHDVPVVHSKSLFGRLLGTHGSRPGILVLGALLFLGAVLMPTPDGLRKLLSSPKKGDPATDPIAGFSDYRKMKVGETVADSYTRASKRGRKVKAADGTTREESLSVEDVARSAKVMIGVLIVAALFWATGAMPIGFTALLVGLLMYLFNVFPPDYVAKAYAKDAVVFIMGVLAFAVGISKTGLDRRIGLILLGTSRSLTRFLFLFLPLLAVTASFLSEHALVAFIAPMLMVVYMGAIKAAGLEKDRALAVILILGICFAANQGGPGSPAAGGRNAVMIGILADYGMAPSFAEWVKYGLPFVPVMSLVIALYFFLRLKRKVAVKNLDVAGIVKKEAQKIGGMTREEYITAGVLAVVVFLWITMSDELGMGGPILLGLVALSVFRIIGWREVNRISWDVVALYASACAMGVGLASTGAALWIAHSFVAVLPDFLTRGEGLCIASSLFTGVLTNFMSDGATVSAIGPVTIPMAQIAGTHPWAVGFATAFASSFANILIIGTPNNAIAYSLAKDYETGEQLVTLGDFAKHGVVVTLLAFVVLWTWTFFGYWQWIGF
jgi:sodium-dependent dicarboxylate transporter 2/3/5